jgi:hypothetical protein
MADENDNFHPPHLDPLKRYVPLAVWTIALLTVLMIPLRIIQYGYLPPDDALRHAGKAVSGKPWPEILVLNGTYKIDHEFGWSLLLEKIHLWTNWDAEYLVIFSVVTLFILAGWSALACLRRPEAWLAALILSSQVFDLTRRLLDGRPFALTILAVTVVLLLWQRQGSSPPNWRAFAWMTALVAFAVFMHDVWYLWVLPIAAFFLARQFRWGFMLAAAWIFGTLFGAALTGRPVEYILQAIQLALRALGMHPTQNTLVGELQPTNGNVFALVVLGGLIVLRQLAGLNATPLARQPAFWLMALGWVMGCETNRFWEDWGAPALMVLMACDFQLFFQARFAADSFKRLALACGLALTLYALTTNDAGSRWTGNLTQQYLTMAEHPDDLNGWLPEKDGIFYTADMTLFYQTFFKNPNADWRYILGFESTLMPDEDFKVYHAVLWNAGDAKAYKPWVDKMRPEDRLVIRGGRADGPNIPQLEWNYGVSGIWIGRTPRTNAPPPAPTIPALATMASPTNSPPLKNSAQ